MEQKQKQKRTKDKVRAAQCPDCGKYMDKVVVRIHGQVAGGVMHPTHESVVGWVCSTPTCRTIKEE